MSRTLDVSPSYFDLVKRFPLRPIRRARDYDLAVKIMNELAVRDEGTLDRGEQDYLDAITVFVKAYDDEHFQIDTSEVTPLDMLKHLMENRQMNVSDLGKVLGSQPLASMILAGKREISRDKAKLLAAHFGVEPGIFI
jgi:HTH-type transcriptional regulator/antitoxin HigA